jgi:hypothetical protein
MRVILRAKAKQRGLLVYFTGKPCKRGHVDVRRVDNGGCRECQETIRQQRRASRPGYRSRVEMDAARIAPTRVCSECHQAFPQTVEFFVLLKNKTKGWSGFSAECRECRNKRFRGFYQENREAQIERANAYVRANPIPKRNRDMIRYMRRKKRGCPPWANQKQLETIYAIADFLTRKTGIPHEVDHYYPLMHPLSCGLHVPWNLRVITTAANQSKGNRLPTL